MKLQWLGKWAGVELDPVSQKEKVISALGGFVGILLLILSTSYVLGTRDSGMVIASMGASAVLLFAVPHGQLSQPWPVLAGHVLSALIGVTCARWIPHTWLAAACAVGLAIGAMHHLKCIHPPGGATALMTVLGGEKIHELGYWFVLCPVLLNALIIVGVAILFNYPFQWRRFPAALIPKKKAAQAIPHDRVVEALRSVDSFVDITEEDLVKIVEILSKTPKRVS